ncbi:hypothetical protein [Sphingomonas sp.]|uniref:hypothetical protein n=1 Tax=Sphingomonas sp. TaxID=28214 RepID=UPI000DB87EBF|nr:hypothetical protein [Sphingomonas sp.]PZU08827.1 MAG: hypothetical protein DI605_11860 [Sphingomonas sp.]
MDGSIFTATVGLAGAAIGGFTSFATTWMTQRAQLRERIVSAERSRRETVYVEFIRESARLFGDALGHERDDVSDLVGLYAILARMRLISTGHVIDAAERVLASVASAYLAPNRSLRELHQFAADGGLDPFLIFSEACRRELQSIEKSG